MDRARVGTLAQKNDSTALTVESAGTNGTIADQPKDNWSSERGRPCCLPSNSSAGRCESTVSAKLVVTGSGTSRGYRHHRKNAQPFCFLLDGLDSCCGWRGSGSHETAPSLWSVGFILFDSPFSHPVPVRDVIILRLLRAPYCSQACNSSEQSAIGLWYDRYLRPMDAITCFWLNRERKVSTKPILRRAESNALCRNGLQESTWRDNCSKNCSAQVSTLLGLTYRRQNSFQARGPVH